MKKVYKILTFLLCFIMASCIFTGCNDSQPEIIYYTVSFDCDGGGEIESQTIESGKKVTKPVNPSKGGYVFIMWILDGVEYDFDLPVTGDITLKAKYNSVSAGTFTVTFDSNGGSVVSNQSVESGDKAIKPVNPELDGYNFQKWTLDGDDYNFDTPVTKDISLVAVYTLGQFRVVFDTMGGSEIETQYVNNGEKAIKPTTDPTKIGKYFSKWMLNGVEFDFNTVLTSSIVLVAEYTDAITVTFNTNGGTAIQPVTVIPGGTVNRPIDPIKADAGNISYLFDKWELDGVEFDFSTPINQNITLDAVYAVYGGTIR